MLFLILILMFLEVKSHVWEGKIRLQTTLLSNSFYSSILQKVRAVNLEYGNLENGNLEANLISKIRAMYKNLEK